MSDAIEKGDKVGDDSGNGTSIDLHIPEKIRSSKGGYLSFDLENFKRVYLSFDLKKFLRKPRLGDVALNILIFFPLGFFFHAGLRTRYGSSIKTFALGLTAGTLLSFGIESLQYFSLTRHSSLIDLFNNILGIITGIAADRLYEAHLKRQVNSSIFT